MLGLAFAPGEETIADYQMNIGAIAVSNDLEAAPAAPTGLKIEKAFDTAMDKTSGSCKVVITF